MNRKKFASYFSAIMLLAFGLAACTAEDIGNTVSVYGESVPVEVSVQCDGKITRAAGDTALSVNRILLLPFRKTDESLADIPANYVPDYANARQLNIKSFPVIATKLNLLSTSTYRIMVLGYNRNDYDFSNQTLATRRFDIGSASLPATLENVYVKPINPLNAVPEFFSCACTGYLNGTSVGVAFKPAQVNQLKGTLKRIVSAFSLQVTNIPAYVNSLSLAAENVVTSTRITDGNALQWQTAGDGAQRTLGTVQPVSGTVKFSYFLLSVPSARQTLFYLDVKYGIFTERYTVKIPDTAGVTSGNRFILTPNHWVRVTGNYSQIGLGFTLTDNINLDDNAWDGLQ